MSERSRAAAMEEARQKAKNLPPETIDVSSLDLEQLVKDYNAREELQKAALTALLMACLQPGGPKRVEFSSNDAWSNIRVNDNRLDIATNAFVDRFISYITKVE